MRNLVLPGQGVYKGHALDVGADTVRSGHGKFWALDGSSYEGEWRDDVRHGEGTLALADGSVYSGTFVAGQRHGKDRLVYSNGDSYEGDWSADNKHGLGVFCWQATGATYRGAFHIGVVEGPGVYTDGDGTKFEGEYKDAKRHGCGTLTHPDGRAEPVEYIDGKRVAVMTASTRARMQEIAASKEASAAAREPAAASAPATDPAALVPGKPGAKPARGDVGRGGSCTSSGARSISRH